MEEMKMERIATPTMKDFLYDEFMKPNKISCYRLSKEINVPVSRIQDILHGRRRLTADTSLRLGKFFGVNDTYFFDLQSDIDFRNTRIAIEEELDKIKPLKLINNE